MPDQGRWIEEVRTLFLSDVHLGCRYSQGERLLEFLQQVRPERIYLVGDFIDAWRLGAGWVWSSTSRRLLKHLTALTADGVEIFYLPGNHDACLRDRDPLSQAILEACGVTALADEFIHETLDGRRLLVTHGDAFDAVERRCPRLSQALTPVYDLALTLNGVVSRLLQRNTSPYAACGAVKDWVKQTIRFFDRFEAGALRRVRERGCDGVICGHLHTPRLFYRDELLYGNAGDWIENCTALVETCRGGLELRSPVRSPAARRLLGSARCGRTQEPLPVPVASPVW